MNCADCYEFSEQNIKFDLEGQEGFELMNLGQYIRAIREQKGLLLREVAARLEIDTAMISKIERGEKTCKKEHLEKLSELLDIPEKELKSMWLAERVLQIVKGEDHGLVALDLAKKELEHGRRK